MKISTREKWVLIIGGIAVAGIVGYLYGVQPFISSQLEVREEIAQQRALLEQYQLLAAEKERYRRRIEQLRHNLDEAQGLLMKGEKLPLAAAELQGLLHRLGQESGVTIVRENVLPPKKIDILNQVTVELSVRGEIKALRDFLYKIHEVPKLLTIPRLTLRASHVRGATVPLSMDLQVAGYTTAAEEKG
jgi:Tfp pilus assembly protein PilO